jgi:hypothetical protein
LITNSNFVASWYGRHVDRTLIRESLKRTIDERFERLVALQKFADELRRAGRDEARRERC